jgi:hypothetical protein
LIVKKRTVPYQLRALEALERRLPTNHPKRKEVENDLFKRREEYEGEKLLDEFLSYIDLYLRSYYIYHDVRLKIDDLLIQLDALVMTPSFFLIIKKIHYCGTLYFDEFEQLIQTVNGKEKGLPNPIFEADWLCRILKLWLAQYDVEHIPIEFLVVNTNERTILKSALEHPIPVVHVHSLPEKVDQLARVYSHPILSEKKLEQLKQQILLHHLPHQPAILPHYNIQPNELITGVYCPECNNFSMERVWGKWICPHCNYSSKTAHEQAIFDYLYLVEPFITNQKCRSFIQCPSIRVTFDLLSNMPLERKGGSKHRKYYLRVE